MYTCISMSTQATYEDTAFTNEGYLKAPFVRKGKVDRSAGTQIYVIKEQWRKGLKPQDVAEWRTHRSMPDIDWRQSHIVQMIGYQIEQNTNELQMIFPYVEGQDLFDEMKNSSEHFGASTFSYEKICTFLRDIAKALDVAAENGLEHHDLYESNILSHKENGVTRFYLIDFEFGAEKTTALDEEEFARIIESVLLSKSLEGKEANDDPEQRDIIINIYGEGTLNLILKLHDGKFKGTYSDFANKLIARLNPIKRVSKTRE